MVRNNLPAQLEHKREINRHCLAPLPRWALWGAVSWAFFIGFKRLNVWVAVMQDGRVGLALCGGSLGGVWREHGGRCRVFFFKGSVWLVSRLVSYLMIACGDDVEKWWDIHFVGLIQTVFSIDWCECKLKKTKQKKNASRFPGCVQWFAGWSFTVWRLWQLDKCSTWEITLSS